MSKKVVYAKLHAGVFIPVEGVGNLSDTLPPNNKTLKNFAMEKQDDGNLRLSWHNERQGTVETVEVGSSNLIVLKFESEKIHKDDKGNVLSA